MSKKIGLDGTCDQIQYFTQEQIVEIYEASGRSSDISKLQQAAEKLYPSVKDSEGIPLWKLPPHGRWFVRDDGTHEPPAFVLVSNKCNSVGIMADGTPQPF